MKKVDIETFVYLKKEIRELNALLEACMKRISEIENDGFNLAEILDEELTPEFKSLISENTISVENLIKMNELYCDQIEKIISSTLEPEIALQKLRF